MSLKQVKFILPNFYNGKETNLLIHDTFKSMLQIYGVQGSFPFSIMNGYYNNANDENIAVYSQIVNTIKDYGILASEMVLIDCGNLLLKPTDYFDSFNKVCFEEFADSNNIYFEIAQIELAEFLIKRYPNIQLIIHQNYTMYHSEEEIQNFINKFTNNIKGIIISGFQECRNIENILKIYFIPLSFCIACQAKQRCILMENNNVLEYSGKSVFAECNTRMLLNHQDIIKQIKYATAQTEYILFDSYLLYNKEEESQIIIDTLKEALLEC